MDSAVSEASIMPLLDPSLSPALAGVGVRRHPPVKRQASALSGSELTSQTADFLRQQQMGWVQMWPTHQLQHGQHQLYSWDAGAGSCMATQQLPSPVMQPLPHGSAAGPMPNGYSSFAAPGFMAAAPAGLDPLGADPAVAAAAAAAGAEFAAGAAASRPGPVAMQASAHRLPKRRASAPHLLAAANGQPQIFKCVPHVGGPDCQCTSCLCARTDELCRRLVAERSARGGTVQAAAPTGGHVLPPAQHQQQAVAQQQHHHHHHHQQQQQQQLMSQQHQHQQQQQDARSMGQSPCHMKRKSFELPPISKSRRSQDGRSPSSSSSPPVYGPGLQVHLSNAPYAGSAACASALNGSTVQAPCLLTSTSSGQLRGQFQHLSVSCSPFEDPTGSCAAAAAAASSQQQVYGDAALGPREVGSSHSTANFQTDEDVDRELERMLAQVGWPLQLPACEPQNKPAGMQQQARHAPQQQHHHGVQCMQPLQAGMQQQMGMRSACGMNPAAAAAFAQPAAHTGHALMMPQQQQWHAAGAAGSYHAGSCALPADAACPDDTAGLLEGLGEELRVPSFDHWGSGGLQHGQGMGPGGHSVPELCPSELQLLDQLLENHPETHHPEEQSFVDLLLN